jgi:hypothetical protein
MLTPLQFKSNYFSILKEYESITGATVRKYMYQEFEFTQESDVFTAEQWNNLVKVASIIKANENRFKMESWHQELECGTAHCIAGWAESLVKNDTNYNDFDRDFNALETAVDMLSVHAKPFFYLTDTNLSPDVFDSGSWRWDTQEEHLETYKGLAEKLVMKWFIDPILEEARKESYELSSEITKFIEKAQQETEAQELTTV